MYRYDESYYMCIEICMRIRFGLLLMRNGFGWLCNTSFPASIDDTVTQCVGPDRKVHGANMGPTRCLSAPRWAPCWPLNLAIRWELIDFGNSPNYCLGLLENGFIQWENIIMISCKRHGVPIHRQLDRCFNNLFRLRTKEAWLVTLVYSLIKDQWQEKSHMAYQFTTSKYHTVWSFFRSLWNIITRSLLTICDLLATVGWRDCAQVANVTGDRKEDLVPRKFYLLQVKRFCG